MVSPLAELKDVRQIPGEPARRWFASAELDLIVWLDQAGAPRAFQLCYDTPHGEHALTWRPDSGFEHAAVDDGERTGLGHKAAPILVDDGRLDATRVADPVCGGERVAAAGDRRVRRRPAAAAPELHAPPLTPMRRRARR